MENIGGLKNKTTLFKTFVNNKQFIAFFIISLLPGCQGDLIGHISRFRQMVFYPEIPKWGSLSAPATKSVFINKMIHLI